MCTPVHQLRFSLRFPQVPCHNCWTQFKFEDQTCESKKWRITNLNGAAYHKPIFLFELQFSDKAGRPSDLAVPKASRVQGWCVENERLRIGNGEGDMSQTFKGRCVLCLAQPFHFCMTDVEFEADVLMLYCLFYRRNHIISTTNTSYPLRMIPPGSEFAVSVLSVNYVVQGINKKSLPQDHVVMTTIKAEAEESPLLRGIIPSPLHKQKSTLYGKEVTMDLRWWDDIRTMYRYNSARFFEEGWLLTTTVGGEAACSTTMVVAGGYFRGQGGYPGRSCWPSKLTATQKETLKWMSPYNLPKSRIGLFTKTHSSGYWSPAFSRRRQITYCAPGRCRVPHWVKAWQPFPVCNDKWDPEYPVGCAPVGSAHAKKYKYDRHISEDIVCSGMDMTEMCNEATKQGKDCGKLMSGGADWPMGASDGAMCGGIHDVFATMPLEANRHVKNLKLVGLPLADDPFKFTASGSGAMSYWWKPPGDLPNAPCTIEPGKLRFENENK